MITDHKLLMLMAIFNNGVLNLSHILQRTILYIHQYSIRIQHKPGPQLFLGDWLLIHNYVTNRDEEIADMCITINAIVMHGYTRLYYSRKNKACNPSWWALRHTVRIGIVWLAISKGLRAEDATAMLIIQR